MEAPAETNESFDTDTLMQLLKEKAKELKQT
jgi:hypothetical protein